MSTKPVKKQVWTNLDAFGLLNGLSIWDTNYLNLRYVRLPDETNLELRRKIKNMHRNPVRGVSTQDLVNGLSNELLLEPYNVISNTTFELTKTPYPSGNINEQDIHVYYSPPNNSSWIEITPQIWPSGYYNQYGNLPESGFIVWENAYYKEALDTNRKTHTYSRLLKIFNDDIPDNSHIKVVYNVKLYDEDNNPSYYKFTDMSNPDNPDDIRFIYRKPVDVSVSGFFNNNIVAYNLNQLPPELSGHYYNNDGSATDRLYQIKTIIQNNFKHKWKDIRDRQSIWDIHKNYSKGTIPSFMDTGFHIPSGKTLDEYYQGENYFTGGVNHHNSCLDIKHIHIESSGSVENWYPVLSPGKFYVNGVQYYLMQNPKYEQITLTNSGNYYSGILPSGIMRHHKVIIGTQNYFDEVDSSTFIFEDYNYKLSYQEINVSGIHYHQYNDEIFRKRPYFPNGANIDINLNSGEYYIDYDDHDINKESNPRLYGKNLHSNCIIIWDDVFVPEGRICNVDEADLNPLNTSNITDVNYFLTLG